MKSRPDDVNYELNTKSLYFDLDSLAIQPKRLRGSPNQGNRQGTPLGISGFAM
jgi:hypothetical protein